MKAAISRAVCLQMYCMRVSIRRVSTISTHIIILFPIFLIQMIGKIVNCQR